jgi:hypothetical protein
MVISNSSYRAALTNPIQGTTIVISNSSYRDPIQCTKSPNMRQHTQVSTKRTTTEYRWHQQWDIGSIQGSTSKETATTYRAVRARRQSRSHKEIAEAHRWQYQQGDNDTTQVEVPARRHRQAGKRLLGVSSSKGQDRTETQTKTG